MKLLLANHSLLFCFLLVIGCFDALPSQAACLTNSVGLKDCQFKLAQKLPSAAAPVLEPEKEIEITVTGTRTRRRIQDSPSTVTVTTDREITNNQIQNIDDLVRYEPGVSVNNRPTRSGNGGYNIRGLDENRVLILVDGIRVPDFYNVTSRDLVEFDSLKRVEILRGPASTLYGSDALGGIVSYTTKNPQDYLNGKPDAVEGKLTYNSADRSISPTFTIASQRGDLSMSATYTGRGGSETSNKSSQAPNPQAIAGNNGIIKLQYRPDAQNDFVLTGELFDRNTTTKVNSNVGAVSPTTTRTAQTAKDEIDRGRISLGHTYVNPEGALIQRVQSNVYYQAANTHEEVEEFRTVSGATPSNRRRLAINDFRQNIAGANVQFESNFTTDTWKHRLSYGAEISSTNTSRPRDNTEFNLTAGTSTKNVGGETFPNKTFPNTDTTRLGIYVQDEIAIGNLTMIPGIRLDTYSLNPNANDPDFIRIGGRVEDVKPINASAISPRLGLVYKISPTLTATAQYSRGFRSPPYDNAAIAFTNFAFGYTVIPNANLKPETSDGFEIGLRTNSSNFNGALSAYYNRYDNFIDTVSLPNTTINGQNLQQFQSQNIRGAEIMGIEAKGEYLFNNSPDGFGIVGSLALAEGKNLERDKPLNSVDPFKSVVGLRYRAPEDRWGVNLTTTLVAGKTNVDATGIAAGQTPVTPAGFTTVDLTGHYKFDESTRLTVGVFNLLDAQYTRWSDVRGLANNNPNLGLFTQPGVTVSASIGVKF